MTEFREHGQKEKHLSSKRRGSRRRRISQSKSAQRINAAFRTDDPVLILLALRSLADERGITAISAASGLNQGTLSRVLSDTGNPKLRTLLSVITALNLDLLVVPKR